MSPTFPVQERPPNPATGAATAGWERWAGDLQSAAERLDPEVLRAVSDTRVREDGPDSLADSDTTLLRPDLAALLNPWRKAMSATKWEDLRATWTRTTVEPDDRAVRAVLSLRLTRRQIQQVTRARLRSADSAARRAAYDRFQLLRQWDGEVTAVEPDKFAGSVGSLDSRTGRTRREHMTFPLRLVRDQDRALVVEGAPFFYCVGRFITAGQVTPGSILWFRRFRENEASTEALIDAAKAASRIDWVS